MCCANVKAKACNFTKIKTPPWVFFTFFKLYEWYQIAQRIKNTPCKLRAAYTMINPFQPSDAFHIETSHFICKASQNASFLYEMQTWAEMG